MTLRDELSALRTAATEFGHRALVAPRPAWPLGLARIVIGIATLGWAASLWFDVGTFLGENALVTSQFDSTLFRWFPINTESGARVALLVLMVCAVLTIAGWRPTIWLIVAALIMVSLQRRTPDIVNSGDVILVNLSLLLALTPSGAALSVHRARRGGFFTAASVAPWGMRLLQLQMMMVYLFAFWSKSGELWRNGSAVSTVFRLDDLQRFEPIGFLVENIVIVAVLTWSTLVLELALGTLLWVKRLRPLLVTFGVILHLMIDTFVLVGFFGLAMLAGLMTFLDGDEIERWFQRRRDRQANLMPTSAPPEGASEIQTSAP